MNCQINIEENYYDISKKSFVDDSKNTILKYGNLKIIMPFSEKSIRLENLKK